MWTYYLEFWEGGGGQAKLKEGRDGQRPPVLQLLRVRMRMRGQGSRKGGDVRGEGWVVS